MTVTETRRGAPLKWLVDHVDYADDECLIWPFSRTRKGYGRLPGTEAHRVMCKAAHGPPPTPQHDAAHLCGNGHLGCIHPRHLQWKTKKENQADKLIHGTLGRGEKNGTAKLTADDVHEIRAAGERGLKQKEIGDRFGISNQQVSKIINGRRWGWLAVNSIEEREAGAEQWCSMPSNSNPDRRTSASRPY